MTTRRCQVEIRRDATAAASRDERLRAIKDQLKAFFAECGGAAIEQTQLLLIFAEMIKNTIDHTQHDALLNIAVQYKGDKPMRLDFSYAEQGPSMTDTLREHVAQIQALQERGTALSFIDLIHWALTPGNSTKVGNGINLGIGLTMITQSARSIGMTLSMMDDRGLFSLDKISGSFDRESLCEAMQTMPSQSTLVYTGSKVYA